MAVPQLCVKPTRFALICCLTSSCPFILYLWYVGFYCDIYNTSKESTYIFYILFIFFGKYSMMACSCLIKCFYDFCVLAFFHLPAGFNTFIV